MIRVAPSSNLPVVDERTAKEEEVQSGAGVRLAGIATDMPLIPTHPRRFGAEEFCSTCQVCTDACLPGAITPQKEMIRGVGRWYVDLDSCIPRFAEVASCGICIAQCPWTRPSVRPKLLDTMARRRTQE